LGIRNKSSIKEIPPWQDGPDVFSGRHGRNVRERLRIDETGLYAGKDLYGHLERCTVERDYHERRRCLPVQDPADLKLGSGLLYLDEEPAFPPDLFAYLSEGGDMLSLPRIKGCQFVRGQVCYASAPAGGTVQGRVMHNDRDPVTGEPYIHLNKIRTFHASPYCLAGILRGRNPCAPVAHNEHQ